ncbi:MAG TPA: hypothetical protein VGV59_09365, partial [Pyrinomonadaceae bacterium]|nr:hypothetical protein [Pyrinomonadaceae bacterium]
QRQQLQLERLSFSLHPHQIPAHPQARRQSMPELISHFNGYTTTVFVFPFSGLKKVLLLLSAQTRA